LNPGEIEERLQGMGRNNYNDIEYSRRGGDENRRLIQD
jgi:hypothetical protein